MQLGPLNRYQLRVLRKMHRAIRVPFPDDPKVCFHDNFWYTQHAWTLAEENKFKKWFVRYMMRNRKAREVFTHRSDKDKFRCERFAQYFVWMYGWKYKKGEI